MDPNQQPQYPQQPQAPMPQGYPQYPQQPVQQPQNPSSGPNIKKILIIAGAFLAVITIIAVIASATGGSSSNSTSTVPLVVVDDQQLSFAISVPEGWEANTVQGTNLLTAEAPDGDLSTMSVFVTEETVEANAFEARVDASIADIESDLFTVSTGLAISEVIKEQLDGVDAGTTYRVAFNAQNAEEQNFRFETYETLLSDGRVLTISLQLTDTYTTIADSPLAILNSFTLR